MLHCENLHIGYDQVLFSIDNLQLKKGELTSLIGPNGGGKTTFLQTLLGNNSPLNGAIYFQGKPLSPTERKKWIANVPSKFNGVAHLSVYDYISLGRAPYTNFLHFLSNNDKFIVEEAISLLGLKGIQHEATDRISDGQRQIASIALALVQEKEVILLDEPTAFLDYSNRRKILHLLRELAIEKQKVILLSSHDLDLCLDFSHQLIAVDATIKQLVTFPPQIEKSSIVEQIFPMH